MLPPLSAVAASTSLIAVTSIPPTAERASATSCRASPVAATFRFAPIGSSGLLRRCRLERVLGRRELARRGLGRELGVTAFGADGHGGPRGHAEPHERQH